jgi:hypothetical protein
LLPSGATFRVPPLWISHLTPPQLDAVARGGGDWDTEFASVCNAALPFDRCAAHGGDDGWGRHSVSFADLQTRVYDLPDPVEDLCRGIEARAAADVKRFSGDVPEVVRDAGSSWRKVLLSYPCWYGDYGGIAHVEFRLRRFGRRTFAFVFMYTDYQTQDKAIAELLDSFRF